MKKNKKNLYKINTSSDIEYSKVIKITLGVLLFLVIAYLFTALITGEIKLGNKNKNIKEETSIQYEEIIAGEILNRNPEEYYVMLFNFTDTSASYYLSLKDDYLLKDDAYPFYIVDLEKHINQSIVLEEGEQHKTDVDNISDLKVEGPVILKIKNHRIVEEIKGQESILNFLKKD